MSNYGFLWMNAVTSGNLQHVEAVMNKRVCPMPSGRPAIISAAEAGNTPLVILLLPRERDVCDDHQRTALMHAAMHNHILVAKELLTTAGRQSRDGSSALMYATWRGHVQMVELLSRANDGVEIGLQRINGETALMLAVRMGHRACVDILVGMEGEIGKQMSDGTTALMLARERSVAELLLAEVELLRRGGLTALMVAAIQDLDEVVDCLIPYLRNRRSDEGHTALMLAARYGATKSVRILCEKTDELGMQDRFGRSALMLAAHCGAKQCAELLIEGEGHLTDYKNRRASAYATDDELRLFLGLFTSGDVDTEGLTTLMHAARVTQSTAVARLVRTQLGMQDTMGRTALMYACFCGDISNTEMFIVVEALASEAGLCDKRGRFALMYLVDNPSLQPDTQLACKRLVELLSIELGMLSQGGLRPLEYALSHEKYVMGAIIYTVSVQYMCIEINLIQIKTLLMRLLGTFHDRVAAEDALAQDQDMHAVIDLMLAAFCDATDDSAKDLINEMLEVCEEDESPTCCICLEQESETILAPCGHHACCVGCLPKIVQICPVCRVPVKDIIYPGAWRAALSREEKPKEISHLPSKFINESTISLVDQKLQLSSLTTSLPHVPSALSRSHSGEENSTTDSLRVAFDQEVSASIGFSESSML